jgi:hypothetical protein
LRVYRDRRDELPIPEKKGGKTRSTQPADRPHMEMSSSGVKIITLDGSPVLQIREAGLYDESKIQRARNVSPEEYSTMDMEQFEIARAVGPDGRTAFKDWEKHVEEEARRDAAMGVLMEVDGKVVQRRYEDFIPWCSDCDTSQKCSICNGKGKRWLFFRCKACAGSGRCLQCLPVSERRCPICGEFIRMQETACPHCGREFICPICKRHLPFEASRCPTCETAFTCVKCKSPVAITHMTSCPKCGGVKVISGRVRIDI